MVFEGGRKYVWNTCLPCIYCPNITLKIAIFILITLVLFNQNNYEYFSMISGVTWRLLLNKLSCDDLFIFYFGRWMCATLVSDFEKCLRAPVSQLRQWRLKAVCTFLAVCHFTALSRALLPQLNLFLSCVPLFFMYIQGCSFPLVSGGLNKWMKSTGSWI